MAPIETAGIVESIPIVVLCATTEAAAAVKAKFRAPITQKRVQVVSCQNLAKVKELLPDPGKMQCIAVVTSLNMVRTWDAYLNTTASEVPMVFAGKDMEEAFTAITAILQKLEKAADDKKKADEKTADDKKKADKKAADDKKLADAAAQGDTGSETVATIKATRFQHGSEVTFVYAKKCNGNTTYHFQALAEDDPMTIEEVESYLKVIVSKQQKPEIPPQFNGLGLDGSDDEDDPLLPLLAPSTPIGKGTRVVDPGTVPHAYNKNAVPKELMDIAKQKAAGTIAIGTAEKPILREHLLQEIRLYLSSPRMEHTQLDVDRHMAKEMTEEYQTRLEDVAVGFVASMRLGTASVDQLKSHQKKILHRFLQYHLAFNVVVEHLEQEPKDMPKWRTLTMKSFKAQEDNSVERQAGRCAVPSIKAKHHRTSETSDDEKEPATKRQRQERTPSKEGYSMEVFREMLAQHQASQSRPLQQATPHYSRREFQLPCALNARHRYSHDHHDCVLVKRLSQPEQVLAKRKAEEAKRTGVYPTE